MTSRLPWSLLCLLAFLCSVPQLTRADDPSDEKSLTFSHVYKILGPSDCKMAVEPQDQASSDLQATDGAVASLAGDNDIVFKHNIKLQTPMCDCQDSEGFKSLLNRVNGLEEEVNFLKSQCSQGCCGKGGAGGVDTSCSGHGSYEQGTCSCQCDPGWEGPDCSVSSCPDECSDNGRCVDGKCACHAGYTGHDCSQLECPGDCNDKGRCVDGKCACFDHFTGDDCGVQRCLNDCVGHGKCLDGLCVCDEGFYGDDCSMVMGPKGLRLIKATDVSLLVDWISVHGAEYYMLTFHPQGQEGAAERLRVPHPENSYLITGLSPGVTYVVEVYAVIGESRSDADSIQATTEVSGIDGIRVVGQTEVSIQVDWQNPAAALDHFRLTHADPAGQEEEESVAVSQEARTKHTIAGLLPGTEYLITVKGIKGSIEGKASSVTGVTDLPAVPSLATREVGEQHAVVTWDLQAGVDGYVLSYSSAQGASGEIPVGADSATYRLTGLRPGVLYTVYVWAVKGYRASRKSSTQAETELDGPKDLGAKAIQKETATLTWKAPLADIEGYVLTYGPEDASAQTVEKRLKARETKLALSGLESAKSYIVTVLAYRGSRASRVVETRFKTVGLLYPFPMDCSQVMKNGEAKSGVYTVYLNSERSKPMEVYCDMDTDGGGWLVFQRRDTGKLDFMKRWRQYIQGFGNMTEEFWLGLENMYELTNTPTQYELRIDLGLGSEKAYAVYDNFKLAPAKQKFKLTVGAYSGNAGDAMTYHQGRPFSTVDSDNDIALGNCALTHRGAWWYKNCHLANLNGKFGDNRHSMGVNWEPWKGHLMSLDQTRMMIRPAGTASSSSSSSRKRRSQPGVASRRGSSAAT